jgi:hypothetical protein
MNIKQEIKALVCNLTSNRHAHLRWVLIRVQPMFTWLLITELKTAGYVVTLNMSPQFLNHIPKTDQNTQSCISGPFGYY